MNKPISKSTLRAISQTLTDAIEGACSCNVAPNGKGYLGHSTGCGVTFNRAYYRKTARFLAESFKELDMDLLQQSWSEEINQDTLENVCKRVSVEL